MDNSPFKSDILKGQVMLISGGASGIGLAISTQFAAHGASVAIMGRRKNVLDDTVASITSRYGVKALAVQGDVRKYENCEEVVRKVVETFGRLDVLINSAAGNFLAPAEKISANAFRTVFDIDVFGTFNLTRAAFPELIKQKSSLVLNITATLDRIHMPFQAHAGAAKEAIESLTRTLANEWGSRGVRVVSIAPGIIDGTEGFERLGGFAVPDKVAYAKDQVPIGSLGNPGDIAYTAIYLASRAGRYVNGYTIVVDGGQWVLRKPEISHEQLEAITAKLRSKSTPAKL